MVRVARGLFEFCKSFQATGLGLGLKSQAWRSSGRIEASGLLGVALPGYFGFSVIFGGGVFVSDV